MLRKDLLLGGAAGTLLCAALVGAAISLGSLLGLDWPGGDRAPAGTSEAANLPAIPSVDNPTAEALRNQIRGPRIVDSQSQPTTRVNAPAPAARTPRTTDSPSIVGRTPQSTSTPPVTPRADSTGTPDAGSVPAPQPASPVVTPAAAIPATPAVVTPAAKKLKLRVASVAVESDDNGSPQLRLSLAVDRNSATSVASAVNVTLRPKMPSHAAGTGPLALRAVVDVVDRPADDSSGEGSAQVPGMQMRVRMVLGPAASSTPAPTPTVADGGDGDTQSQSNVIALNVPLTAFVDPNDNPAEPVEPTEPATPAPAPAEPTEVRLDMPTTENPDAHPATDTANVPAPALPVDHAPSDVPVTVVVDSAPAPDPAPAPAPTPDPAPAPTPDPAPAPAPADPTPTPAPPTTPPGYPSDNSPTTAETTPAPATPPADPGAAAATAAATTPAATPDASSSGSGSSGS